MFGTTPLTAWELEADRRRELAMSWRPPRVEPAPRPERRSVSLRRLIDSWRHIPPAGLEDVRT